MSCVNGDTESEGEEVTGGTAERRMQPHLREPRPSPQHHAGPAGPLPSQCLVEEPSGRICFMPRLAQLQNKG